MTPDPTRRPQPERTLTMTSDTNNTPDDTASGDDDLIQKIDSIAHELGGEVLSGEQLAGLIESGERHAMERDEQARSEGRRFVDEETDSELIEAWWADAKGCRSVEDAAALAHRLITDYRHDYGTICHAIGAASYAMAEAMNASPSGHITGFQAGAVQWMWLRHWNQWDDAPRRLIEYGNLLYPADDHTFTEISPETADWLIAKAEANLIASPDAHPNVIARWRDIAAGRFPSFLRITEES